MDSLVQPPAHGPVPEPDVPQTPQLIRTPRRVCKRFERPGFGSPVFPMESGPDSRVILVDGLRIGVRPANERVNHLLSVQQLPLHELERIDGSTLVVRRVRRQDIDAYVGPLRTVSSFHRNPRTGHGASDGAGHIGKRWAAKLPGDVHIGTIP